MISLRVLIPMLLCSFAAMLRRGSISYTARYGYLSDAQLHWQAAAIRDQHVSYKKCSNDAEYRYIEVSPPNSTLKAIVVCNIHARELISSKICLNWLKQLRSNNYAKTYKIQLFLIANKNRQKFIDNEGGCQRKNENGVDLNRNFPTDFNHFHLDKNHQIYPGNQPIDQPFTICLNQLINAQRLDLFIDVHSGMKDTAFYQQGINNINQLQILNKIKSQTVPTMRISTLKLDNQTINGHIFADLKVRKNVKYSFLFQTYLQNNNICFLNFNPIGEEKIKVTANYVKAINTVFQSVAQFQHIKRPRQ